MTLQNRAMVKEAMLIALFAAILSLAAAQPVPSKPHIVFTLVDDWGFADVGFRNPQIKTPNFDMLAKTGLILDRHYVFKYCSPSRASLLTGRWPHHAHQWNVQIDATVGLNLNMTLLPAKLRQAGYATHMVGKWHEGFPTPAYLPINRGFDTSSGFLYGAEDHFTQRDGGCAVDYWKDHEPDTRNGTYDAYTYREDLNNILTAHDPTTPMFLYLPLHNVHGPFQAPKEWLDVYPEGTICDFRRTYQAMVSVADNVTGTVVDILKQKGMWDNTIFVVSADNGGAQCAGSNFPLKGAKLTFFEGGVRSIAFANGGLLPKEVRGTTSDGFIHIADWYPTFCKMAGVDSDDSGTGKFPVDGVDVWPIISGQTSQTTHEEIVLGFNYADTAKSGVGGAIIVGDYKLIVGNQDAKPGCNGHMWSPIDYPCTKGSDGPDCNPHCLYNIVEDPGEHKDLTESEPTLLKKLLDRYNSYFDEPRAMQDQGYHVHTDVPTDSKACSYMTAHGGYWRPWRNVNDNR